MLWATLTHCRSCVVRVSACNAIIADNSPVTAGFAHRAVFTACTRVPGSVFARIAHLALSIRHLSVACVASTASLPCIRSTLTWAVLTHGSAAGCELSRGTSLAYAISYELSGRAKIVALRRARLRRAALTGTDFAFAGRNSRLVHSSLALAARELAFVSCKAHAIVG
jgi:hypothetical protein